MVYPIKRGDAKKLCEQHPHAQSLPNSTKLCLGGYINGRLVGLAAWGYGINPSLLPGHLFGSASVIKDYLELCRFFVYDFAPANTATDFLAATHRIIRKHMPDIKYLYTYAAGFQGMIGTIYQAANYLYIGNQICRTFIYIPNIGLVHGVSLYHRYSMGRDILAGAETVFGCKVYNWIGENYRYIYFLCQPSEVNKLMESAKFTIQPFPVIDDIEIHIIDTDGNVTPVSIADAKQIPIVKLPTKRLKDSSEPLGVPPRKGGATPTQPLQSLAVKV